MVATEIVLYNDFYDECRVLANTSNINLLVPLIYRLMAQKGHIFLSLHIVIMATNMKKKRNGKWCIYIVPLSKALYTDCASHSHTDGGGNHARHLPAHQELLKDTDSD